MIIERRLPASFRIALRGSWTGETTDLGSIVADLLEPNCCGDMEWSPDRTRIAFGAVRGAVYTVDVRSGERSLLVRLPGLLGEDIPWIWGSCGRRMEHTSRSYMADACT